MQGCFSDVVKNNGFDSPASNVQASAPHQGKYGQREQFFLIFY